jgi:hypothetical protein
MSSRSLPTVDTVTADDVLDEVRSAARALARGGFLTFDDVLARCLEVAALADDAPSAGTVERIVRHEWDVRAAALAAERVAGAGDDARLDAAFADLEAQGLFARAGLGDCAECGAREARAAALPGAGWVFFPEDAVQELVVGRLNLVVGHPDPAERDAVIVQVLAALDARGLVAVETDDGVRVQVSDWRRGLPTAACGAVGAR